MSENGSMPVVILNWRALRRNTLRGFVSIRLGAALKIHDVTVHRHDNGKSWASFPAKPAITAEKRIKQDENGKDIYIPVLEWANKEAGHRFSESVIVALELAHPGATN